MGLFTQYLRSATVAPFFNALRSRLRDGCDFDQCASELRGYFTTPSGRPNGKQLRTYVENMVCFNHAPQDFRTWWHDNYTVRVEHKHGAWTVLPLKSVEATTTAEKFPAAAEVILEAEEEKTLGTDKGTIGADSTEKIIKPEPAAITVANIAGLPLEVIEYEWVTLRSLFEPFGKEVEKQVDRLETWANLRKSLIPSRSGSTDTRGKHAWTIHRDHVAQAIAELDPRGMAETIKERLVAFKRECAAALNAYFSSQTIRRETSREIVATKADPAVLATLHAIQGFIAEQREHNDLIHRVHEAATTRLDARIDEVANDVATLKAAIAKPAPARQAAPRKGFLSRVEAAKRLGLPSDGPGSRLLHEIAKRMGLFSQSEYTDTYTFMRGAAELSGHLYSPLAVHVMAEPATAAIAAARKRGWRVDGDGQLRRYRSGAIRTSVTVVREMQAAAIASIAGGEAVAAE